MGLTVQTCLTTKTIRVSFLAVVNVDTAVQDKAVAFPTNARLFNKVRIALVKMGVTKPRFIPGRGIRDIQRKSRQLQLPAKQQAPLGELLKIAQRIRSKQRVRARAHRPESTAHTLQKWSASPRPAGTSTSRASRAFSTSSTSRRDW